MSFRRLSRILAGALCLSVVVACKLPSPPVVMSTVTPTDISSATLTLLPTSTLIPSPTDTPDPSPTPTPAWVWQGPGRIICPILLYHRIDVPRFSNEYYVTPEDFRQQMQALKDWGYTAIPVSLLVEAITQGARLPERPVVITFDDGDITVYTTAFPVMRELGFVGVVYLVGNRLNVDGYMRPAQIAELTVAGWEVGSHSMAHSDLRSSTSLDWEVRQSRLTLEAALGVPVRTFAYPFGLENRTVINKVRAHYDAAVGLGPTAAQDFNKLYYLWRRPVKYGWDLKAFASFLPWSGPLETPTPTP